MRITGVRELVGKQQVKQRNTSDILEDIKILIPANK